MNNILKFHTEPISSKLLVSNRVIPLILFKKNKNLKEDSYNLTVGKEIIVEAKNR